MTYKTEPDKHLWRTMIKRCTNPKAAGYHRYGGRGITVCQQWIVSFDQFIKDMGPRPSKDHSIDRIDNNGPYQPGNCRWATRHEQGRNKSTNRVIAFNGREMIITDWAKEIGISPKGLQGRLNRMPVEQALTVKSGGLKAKASVELTYQGKTRLLVDWAREYGLNPRQLRKRLATGWDLKTALKTPTVAPRRSAVLLTLGEETMQLEHWAKKLGTLPTTIAQRLKAGWSVEKTLTTPIRPKKPAGMA